MRLVEAIFAGVFQFRGIALEDKRIFPCQPIYIPGMDILLKIEDHFGDHAQVRILHEGDDLT